MKVRLISHSQMSTDTLGIETIEQIISFCARVSNPENQSNNSTSSKLVKYLIKNKHFSPLEMVSICFEIETTRDISRQILRHRSFSFQEFSQRYADPVKELYFLDDSELREYRTQDPKNRQNSFTIDDLSEISDAEKRQLNNKKILWENLQKKSIEQATENYQEAIALGVAKEQARSLLPEGLIKTKMYMNGTLRSWLHFCQLRMANGTQKEHSEIAKEICEIISQQLFNLKEFIDV